ncbi:MAG: ABC transporter permease [Nitriliruptorales bacterium]|nr:ABC transporter permease [Nitriliruptorales bacterium]
MNFGEALRVAGQALRANRLRSLLTTLGVVIGVLAVVLLVAIGQGARQEITGTIEGLGSNLLFAVPGSGDFTEAPSRARFTLDDVERVERAIGERDRVAAYLVSGETVRSAGQRAAGTVFGVSDAFTDVVTREVDRGQELAASDIVTARRVALLGSKVADSLFPGEDPIGQTITIGGLRFRVGGTLEPVGGSVFGPDRDEQVLIPITAAQRLFGTDRVDAIFVRANSTATITEDADLLEATLAERIDPAEFSILTQEDLIGVISRVLELMTLFLAAIAGISLLVGGVGVSNIMLVSVSERTREIGLRKALGARTRDITLQFLLEAVALTGLGGLLGVASGIGLAGVVDRYAPIPAIVTGWSVALAIGVSIAVGVFFGVWPARRAGRLDPVAALRHE